MIPIFMELRQITLYSYPSLFHARTHAHRRIVCYVYDEETPAVF